jgi:peroxiredoxin
MKKAILFLLPLIAIISFSFNSRPIESIKIGDAAPMATTKLTDAWENNTKSLTDCMGEKGLLVMFSCNTCPYVIKNQARTLMVAKYAIGKGLGVAIINSNEAYRNAEDSEANMKTYANAQGYYFPYLVDVDNKLADAFGATRTPEIYIFKSDKKLAYHGAIDDNPGNEAEATQQFAVNAIEDIANGRAVAVSTSKSVGCSIKRKN